QKAETGRVSVRSVRQDAVKKLTIQQKAKENPISENEQKRASEQVQKLVDKYIAEIEQLAKAKEADLMEV
ncbi:MAG: ribosome recycling factor, partial [Bradyrhizobium sp.]|nr:ribosome recycling factor [Bradyrhizobium sp.]